MAVRARGGEAAPVRVVLVHGPLSSAEIWERLTELLAADPELTGRIAVSRVAYEPVSAPASAADVIDTAADRLGAHLRENGENGAADDPVVLVTHGLGGLVAQRFVCRALAAGQTAVTARIGSVVMFACPNSGTRLVPYLCRRLRFRRAERAEQWLRIPPRQARATRRAFLRAAVDTRDRAGGEGRLPVYAYAGAADRVVAPRHALGPFTAGGIVPGGHRTLVCPAGRDAPAYRAIRARLLAASRAAGPERIPEGPVSVVPPYGRLQGRLQGGERHGVIATVLTPDPRARVHVLAGAGGSGKSRLALEIADRARRTGRHVWWAPMTQVTACMREIANQLGAPPGQVEQAFRGEGSATDLVWRCLEDSPQPWLLVFDNVDDPERLGPLEGSLSDNTGWLREPATPRGLVVVTTSDTRQDTWVPRTRVHLVRPLSDDDGGSVLREFAEGGGTMAQARALSAQLGGLPLALRAAAAHVGTARGNPITLHEPGIRDFDTYRAAVRQRFKSPPGTGEGRRGASLGLEVMSEVCDLALDLLAEDGLAEAAPLLKSFACLSTAPIPYRLLMNSPVLRESPLFTGFPLARREAVLRGLARLCLVDVAVRPEAGEAGLGHVLSLSPVVHGLLRGDADVQHRRDDYYGFTTRLLLDVTKGSDPDTPESWPVWSAIAPHAMEVARTSLAAGSRLDARVLTDALELARLTARYLIVFGLLRPARELTGRIVSACEEFGFARDDPKIAGIRHEAARVCLEAGEWPAAEAELRLVAAAREEALSAEHPDTLASRHKLARALLEQGRYGEARALLRSVVQAEYRVRGPEHSDTITVRHSLARALWEAEQLSEAETELRAVLEVSLRKWSPRTHETLRIHQTLARILLETDRPEAAEAEIDRALRAVDRGSDSPAAMALRFTLSQLYLMECRIPEAVDELNRLLEDRVRVMGDGNPETERTRALLARAQEVPSAQ